MEGTIVALEKPTARVALPDWHGKVWELRQTCDTRRKDAFALRNEARKLRNETETKTSWNFYHNNNRLKDRLLEISRWRDVLENYMKLLEKEMADLSKEKASTESEIEFLSLNFSVVNQCLTQRDQRGGADLCTDDAEIEIKHEKKMLDCLKVMLTERCMATWEELNRLEEVKLALEVDIGNKDEAVEIDTQSLGLDKHGSNLSYKPNALEIPKRMISYPSWLEHCLSLKLKAEDEMKISETLRESMFAMRERVRNDLKAQDEATRFALRKRIYETERIKNELEWQRLNMAEDIERLGKEVDSLEFAYSNKVASLKLAETRLESRGWRPGPECSRDDAMEGLIEEANELRATRESLWKKLGDTKATYNALEDQLAMIDRELSHKRDALMTDIKCLDLRKQLETGPGREPPQTQTDRNIILTKMADQIPPE